MSEKYAIVVGKFNDLISRSLLSGAVDQLAMAGVARASVDVHRVPGCFEIPLAAQVAAESGKYAAVICLGAVIRGETPHFDFVAGQAASGIMSVSLDTQIPIIFGVLTTNNVEQALNRSGIKHGNKGADAARAALDMVNTLAEIKS